MDKNKPNNATNPAKASRTERKHTRWIVVLIDAIIYVLCWLAFFTLEPGAVFVAPTPGDYVYLFSGFILFFGLRFALKCYKQVWRFNELNPFALELLAGAIAAVCLIGLSEVLTRGFDTAFVAFMDIAPFVATYILISLAIRISYCYVFRFAKRSNRLSKTTRFLLERLALVDFTEEPSEEDSKSSKPIVPSPINEMQNIAESFAIHGNITSITQINKGYINRTYRVETLSEAGHVHKYTLQRINTNVFPDVQALMDNFELTTAHLHKKFLLPGHGEKGSVQMIRSTKDGKPFLKDDSGCWRMMTHFDGVYSLDIPDSPETFYHAGSAFGRFLKEMSDVDPSLLKETIPNFHNTKSRYLDLEKAISQDPKGRVKNVTAEIEFVRARADKFGMITEALESGKIPTRVCHNDCNLNNILFDNETHLPVAIIDLDTVMPSSPLYDYGDSMRIGTNTAKDDETDLSKVTCDLNLYEQYARGYLSACGDVLTKEELELLPYASLIITSEDGIRFLADYINGDTYYNIYYPNQNLDRARNQLKLLEDMEKKLPEIRKILQKIYDELGFDAQVREASAIGS